MNKTISYPVMLAFVCLISAAVTTILIGLASTFWGVSGGIEGFLVSMGVVFFATYRIGLFIIDHFFPTKEMVGQKLKAERLAISAEADEIKDPILREFIHLEKKLKIKTRK